MTIRELQEQNYDLYKEVRSNIANWLKPYTHETIVKVLAHTEEIISNEFTLNLLKELHQREIAERNEFEHNIDSLLCDLEAFAQYDPHNHCLEHASSYRDVLYDMYIRRVK